MEIKKSEVEKYIQYNIQKCLDAIEVCNILKNSNIADKFNGKKVTKRLVTAITKVLEEYGFNDMNVKLVSRYKESNDYVQISIEDKNYQGVLYLYGLDNALFERDGTFSKKRFLMVIDERFVEAKQKLRTANQSMLLKDKFFEEMNEIAEKLKGVMTTYPQFLLDTFVGSYSQLFYID